jgi:hypothetical protein
VVDCQAFTMTAPGPGSEGNARFQQRRSIFCSLERFDDKLNSASLFEPPDGGLLRDAGNREQNQNVGLTAKRVFVFLH